MFFFKSNFIVQYWITILQSDIQQLERTRESMARELVNLTNQNEALEEKVEELPQLQNQFKVHVKLKYFFLIYDCTNYQQMIMAS